MLEIGVPVGAGTDGTRVASYNPWLSLYWLVTGRTVGGLGLYPENNRFDRMEALRLYTVGSSWFSSDDGKKGSIAPGQLADLSVLSADYFTIPEEEIKQLESVLTIVGGKVVYAAKAFANLAPPPLPVSPDWSPVKTDGGFTREAGRASTSAQQSVIASNRFTGVRSWAAKPDLLRPWWFSCGCFV
jgi:Amidohydrolase family